MDIFLTSVWGTARSVDLAVEAERAGVRTVWLAEHHGSSYGLCDDALALAVRILKQTSRLCVGTAAIPFWRWTPAALANRVLTLASRWRLGAVDGVALNGQVAMDRVAGPGGVTGPGGGIAAVGGREALDGGAGPGGRLTVGVARGSWPEARVGGCSQERYEAGFAPWLKELADLLRGGPPMVVAASSRETVELAGSLGLPLLIGVENDDEMVAEKLRSWGPGGDHVRLVLPSIVDRDWMVQWQGRKLAEPAAYVDRIMSIRPSGSVRTGVMVEAAGQFRAALRAVRTER